MGCGTNKLIAAGGALLLATALAGCSIGGLVGAPTPEPWRPPLTATTVASPTVIAAEPTLEAVARRTVMVERGTLPDIMVLSGQVTPVLERELAFRQEGVLRSLYVEPGMPVTVGQLLAELDLGTLREQLSAAQEVAAQELIAIGQAREAGGIDVRSAEIALEAAQSRLDELKSPPSGAEVAKARAAVAQAEATLALTRNDASAIKSKAERALADAVANLTSLQAVYGDIKARLERRPTNELRARLAELEPLLRAAESEVALARIDVDTARGNEIAAVQAAEADFALARAALEELVSSPDPFEIAEAERAVRQAEVNLAAARQAAAPDPSLAKSLAAAQLAVKDIESQIEVRRIYAPFDGTITSVDALVSFPVQAEVPVIRIMDGSGLQVTVPGIAEEDLQRFTLGFPVSVSFAREPDRELRGTVQKPATGFSALSGAPTLHVAYDAPNLDLSIGDPATITASFGVREGVLILPAAAIRREGGAHVLILDGETERRVDVTLGIAVDEQVEIVAGLSERDIVVLP